MITSVKKWQDPWPADVVIEDLKHAGLPVPSLVRFKIFTLDHRFILERLGSLSETDRPHIQKKLKELLLLD